MITRVRGKYIGRNAASAYKDLVWTVATAIDTTLDIEGQTRETLVVLDKRGKKYNSVPYSYVLKRT